MKVAMGRVAEITAALPCPCDRLQRGAAMDQLTNALAAWTSLTVLGLAVTLGMLLAEWRHSRLAGGTVRCDAI